MIGTRCHEALASYYVPDTQKPQDPRIVHAARQKTDFETAVQSGYSNEQLAELQKNFSLEETILSGYMEWISETGIDSDLIVEDSEIYLEYEILPGVFVIGKIDTLSRSQLTGEYINMDHKIVGAFAKPYLLRLNEQLLHYEFLVSKVRGIRVAKSLYNMSKRSKRTSRATPPFYLREEVAHNAEELESFRQRLLGTISQMLAVEERLRASEELAPPQLVYPTPSLDCDWKCEFASICGMFDDGSRVGDALKDLYTLGNPLSYYQGKEQHDSA